MANIPLISDANFDDEVLKSDLPVLVDFWAIWCGPCKMVEPIVETLAQEYAGKLKVVKMDVDKNPNVPMRYGIRSIPTLLFFKNGQVVDQVIGAVPKRMIEDRIRKIID
ncbi:MAG TPA: thioredoxin [Bacteroidetes bacterium]|nr:thioredoxin [Bacteroidota bacterium]